MRSSFRTIGLWFVLIVLFVAFYNFFSHGEDSVLEVTWSAFLQKVDENKVGRVSVNGTRYRGVFTDTNERFRTTGPPADSSVVQKLRDGNVDMTFEAEQPANLWMTIAGQWLPVTLIFVFFIYFFRGARSKGATDPLKLEFVPERINETIGLTGLKTARSELQKAADAARAGQPGPRRILITGPTGTGKTRLLRAAAADARLPLFAQPGSQFIEVFVGVGAARIRKLFEAAAKAQPCLVAIDDVDAFATRRAPPANDGRVDERAGTMLELNNRLDGLSALPPKVLFIATTSRADLLDEAFVRPGRFDLEIRLEPGGTCAIEHRGARAALG